MEGTAIVMDFSVIMIYYLSMTSTLEYLVDKEALAILDHFTTLFNVRIAFFSNQQEEIAAGRAAQSCLFCRRVRNQLKMARFCRECDDHNFQRAATSRTLVSYHCHAGLLEAIYPVVVYERLIGYIMMGQCRTGESMNRKILEAWRRRFGESAGIENAFLLIPMMAGGKVESLLRFFRLIVQYIIDNNLVKVTNNVSVDIVAEFIRKNVHRKIALKQAADLIGRSPTTLTHLIKKTAGKSFKRLCLEIKLNEAEKLLKTMPGCTVAEAAQRTGFDDQFYFSRVFTKYKKVCPSALKKPLMNPASRLFISRARSRHRLRALIS
jgi:AraC-like DNA-binding protein